MQKPLSFANAVEEQTYYGVGPSALRAWKAKGVKADDPFPSADPNAVVSWYRRNFQKSVPQSLALAAATFSAVPAKKKTKVQELESLDSGSLANALDRQRRIYTLYGAKLEAALKDGNRADEELYRDPHTKALQALRDLEKVVVHIAKQRRELIDRNAVTTAWTNMHGHLPRALSRALLAAKPPEVTSEEWGRITRKALDDAMELMPSILPEILAGSPVTDETDEPEMPSWNSSSPSSPS
jgi:hypothetical protein